MTERRKLGDAMKLTPEKLAFIRSADTGKPGPSQPGKSDEVTTSDISLQIRQEARSEAAMPETSTRSLPEHENGGGQPKRKRKPAEMESREANDDFYGPILAPITTRLSPATADALRRACLEQKLARRRPHTQQDIVERAVVTWLEANGFL